MYNIKCFISSAGIATLLIAPMSTKAAFAQYYGYSNGPAVAGAIIGGIAAGAAVGALAGPSIYGYDISPRFAPVYGGYPYVNGYGYVPYRATPAYPYGTTPLYGRGYIHHHYVDYYEYDD